MPKFKNPIKGEDLRDINTSTDYDTLKLDSNTRQDTLLCALDDIKNLLKKIELHLSVVSDVEVNDDND